MPTNPPRTNYLNRISREELERLIAEEFLGNMPCVPGMVMNHIHDVTAWSKTSRGGYQNNLFRILNEHAACESKYGLCE